MFNDNKPSAIVSAIGLALVINSIIFIVVYFIGDEGLFWRVVSILPAFFVLFTAAPFGQQGIYDWLARAREAELARHGNAIEVVKLKTTYAKLVNGDGLNDTLNDPLTIDNDAESKRLGLWRAYWIRVMEWSREHGGVVSYRNGLQAIMKYQDWIDSLAFPFIRKGWMTPVYQGGKSKLADGISVAHILNELSASRCPPAPFGDPPVLRTVEHGETQENAYQNSGREFEHA